MHVSFKKEADNDGAFFQVPMLGASNEWTKDSSRILG
jgi:hypothetical protein